MPVPSLQLAAILCPTQVINIIDPTHAIYANNNTLAKLTKPSQVRRQSYLFLLFLNEIYDQVLVNLAFFHSLAPLLLLFLLGFLDRRVLC